MVCLDRILVVVLVIHPFCFCSLHLRGNCKEVVVGWYISAASEEKSMNSNSSNNTSLLSDTSLLIHKFYAGECGEGDPIHLVMDTRLIQDSILI